jgi:hypothetical protein
MNAKSKKSPPPVFLIVMLLVFGGLWLGLARRQQNLEEEERV